MLEVDELVTSYGAVRALDEVSLSTKDGAITAVLGANGAGKTTLLRTIGGLVAPDSGRVRFNGTDVTGWPADRLTRSGLVHVPESGGVITELTVEENLRLGALWRRDRADRAAALREVLDLFPPLAERRGKLAATLSGGERQMLAIGRALMGRPRLLLLDEPSLGLAPLVTLRILQVIEDLRAATGLTVLLVEQNARSALSVADHGFVLSLGRVVATDRAEDLLADDQLRHAYLGF
ncbi:ABC transporter ATP-binding protein [Amycolatopsis sp. YIM 10]|uniref:ABC transporter ATP-binding protein n=1 Tax=Amycolatopsis sp. YIM 10 TaxID=2653857 RepID=UPI0012906E21|nr:ABC transporter ATP-binding protein [Amycolatopsis sp. YIM 10]QFU90872.1 High-affinity branched-chain amino acid transport ATP-binding protein LivF [Amycolatopsis sp. YIM 10]